MEDTARWWMAAPSGALGREPMAVVVDGTALVLFRDRQGRPAALLDRCPHQDRPLSKGHCRKGQLVCRYHGWEFDHDGVCQRIPADRQATQPQALLSPYATCEQDGYVWVTTTDRSAAPERPEALPLAGRRWWQTRLTVPHAVAAVTAQLGVLASDTAPAGGFRWSQGLPGNREVLILVWAIPVDASQTRLEVLVERLGLWPFRRGQTAYRQDLPLPVGLQALQVSDSYSPGSV